MTKMEHPKYKLIYFNIRGRAEPLRLMFAYAKVPFEDYRIKELPSYLSPEPSPEWDALKKTLPFGTVPVLEVDGKYLGETNAIARFLAKRLGLAGANRWEAAQADSIVSYVYSDFEMPCIEYVREMNPDRKRLLLSRMLDRIAKVSDKLENILQKNIAKNGSGFYVGESLTLADFTSVTFYYSVETLVMPGFMGQFHQNKLLREHVTRMRALPGIREFIESHANVPS